MNDHILCIGVSLLLGIAAGSLGVVFAALEVINRKELEIAEAAEASFKLGVMRGKQK